MKSILSIFQADKKFVEDKTLAQIIAFTGNGKLRDGNQTSKDFREFLSEIPSHYIEQYAVNCLTESFSDSGLALQDIINQVGRRLSYNVADGLYQGNKNSIGFDGIWESGDGHSIIVEVKTTDAYRINLDTSVVQYRQQLIKEGKVDKDKSSILIVVGREDTGGLEAQIRDSRHAWDIRLISTDSLLKLLLLKETFNDTKTIQQITELLKPREFTRIDELIDLIFTTSKDLDLQLDVLEKEEIEDEVSEKRTKKSSENKSSPVNFNDACYVKVQEKLGVKLVKQSKVAYSNQEKSMALICAVSKEYKQSSSSTFWFAFHPHQQDFLNKFQNGYVAFGCGTANVTFLIPFKKFEPLLKNCNTTNNSEKRYWHIHIFYRENEYFIGQPRKGRGEMVNITKYKI